MTPPFPRPIKPTSECLVRIRKDRDPQNEYARTLPWMISTRYPGEPGFTQVGRFISWKRALAWMNLL